MNYYSNVVKSLQNGKQIVDRERYSVDGDNEIEKLKTEMFEIQEKLDGIQEKIAQRKEEIYKDRYTPSTCKKYVRYKKTGTLYDWDTCSPVDEIKDADSSIVFSTNRVNDNFACAIGYDIENGIIIIGEYNVRIESAKLKLRHKLVDKSLWSFINGGDSEKGCWNFKTSPKETREFINKFFDIDYRGQYELKDLASYYKNNKCFEIIIREAPDDIKDKLLRCYLKTAQPLNKLFGLTRPGYQICKEENLLKILTLRLNNEFQIPTNETELIEIMKIARDTAEDFDFYGISTHSYSYGENDEVFNIFKELCTSYYNDSVVNSSYTLKKYTNYVIQETINQGYETLSNFCQELKDYLVMCKEQSIKPTLYSSYLKQTHDVCSRNYKIKLEKEQEVMFKKRYEDYKDEKIGDFMVIYPKCSDDLIREGNNLNHCVGTYIKRVIDGSCMIFFLRKEKDTSLITFEVRDNKVCQIRGAHNRNPLETEVMAINAWCEKHKINKK